MMLRGSIPTDDLLRDPLLEWAYAWDVDSAVVWDPEAVELTYACR